MHPLQYSLCHRFAKSWGMVKDTKTLTSWERNIHFLWNINILNLCIRWQILKSYCFTAEVIFKKGHTQWHWTFIFSNILKSFIQFCKTCLLINLINPLEQDIQLIEASFLNNKYHRIVLNRNSLSWGKVRVTTPPELL